MTRVIVLRVNVGQMTVMHKTYVPEKQNYQTSVNNINLVRRARNFKKEEHVLVF